jgi:hypothetical protein
MKFLAVSEDKKSLGNWFRDRRFPFFQNKVDSLVKSGELSLPVKILDVGGCETFWANRGWNDNPNYEITLVNLHYFYQKDDYSNIKRVIGDATNLSQFRAEDYDIVFSNSVIEHLYTYENQKSMADECARLGKRYFIQTPNKYFFLEPHFLLPWFQFLPRNLQKFILTKTKLSRGRKWDKERAEIITMEIKLLSKRDLIALFPRAKIYTETFIGLDKSYTVYNF